MCGWNRYFASPIHPISHHLVRADRHLFTSATTVHRRFPAGREKRTRTMPRYAFFARRFPRVNVSGEPNDEDRAVSITECLVSEDPEFVIGRRRPSHPSAHRKTDRKQNGRTPRFATPSHSGTGATGVRETVVAHQPGCTGARRPAASPGGPAPAATRPVGWRSLKVMVTRRFFAPALRMVPAVLGGARSGGPRRTRRPWCARGDLPGELPLDRVGASAGKAQVVGCRADGVGLPLDHDHALDVLQPVG